MEEALPDQTHYSHRNQKGQCIKMFKYFAINGLGFSVHCKLYANDIHDTDRVILFGHGFGGHMDNKAAERFADRVLAKYKHAAVVTFNWPCHGNDALKRLRLRDCDAYLSIVTQYIQNTLSAREIYGFATSFGGYLFLKYISEHGSPFAKLALRCPVIDMYDILVGRIMTGENRESLKKGRDAMVGFDRKIRVDPQFVQEIRSHPMTRTDFTEQSERMLILHGSRDEIVPFQAVKTFSDDNLIEFVSVEGADHRFQNPAHMETATKAILNFFEL